MPQEHKYITAAREQVALARKHAASGTNLMQKLPGEHSIPGMTGWMGHSGFNWNHRDSGFVGPHERQAQKAFEPHIPGYEGHQPNNWNPFSGKHLEGGPSTMTSKYRLPRAALSAGGSEPGLWFGKIEQFPKAGSASRTS
eukprot:TRINITY_DN86556_c0_g1_i1.p1 TRINITY_DN86556_c0_g1~~TRINITY_DN86556_c0_g1_i1.p1  ORF type:complete len:140 (-),score=17.31 TRINITY_DN86556_c0_g1_i1:276-695(-)